MCVIQSCNPLKFHYTYSRVCRPEGDEIGKTINIHLNTLYRKRMRALAVVTTTSGIRLKKNQITHGCAHVLLNIL